MRRGSRADAALLSPTNDFDSFKRSLIRADRLFEDPDFPAELSSIYYSPKYVSDLEWKRPHEISRNCKFIIDGATRFDVKQGELGDCWFLAAVANLTMYPEIKDRVIPSGQSFSRGEYSGAFKFTFWRSGRWVDVVIDDRLPTRNGKLLFLQSSNEHEFWSPLLEKAYAKANGSYEALDGGWCCEAMQDFTGGVTETFDLQDKAPSHLWDVLLNSFSISSMMSAGTMPDKDVFEKKTIHGLIKGHAYSITNVKEIKISLSSGTMLAEKLIRLRNPWGEQEWSGSWSDDSSEWDLLSREQIKNIGLQKEEDGEFWMRFSDFKRYLDRVEFCHFKQNISLTQMVIGDKVKSWDEARFESSWVDGVSAGGCFNNYRSYAENPQFQFNLTNYDNFVYGQDQHKCFALVALLQKNRRKERHRGLKFLPIGFDIYKIDESSKRRMMNSRLDRNWFTAHKSLAGTAQWTNSREVSERIQLPAGAYVIVPSTYRANSEADFLLRIFTEGHCPASEIDDQTKDTAIDIQPVPKPQPKPQPKPEPKPIREIDPIPNPKPMEPKPVTDPLPKPAPTPPTDVIRPTPKRKPEAEPKKTTDANVKDRFDLVRPFDIFFKHCRGDYVLDNEDLKRLLQDVLQKGFCDEYCRQLIALQDTYLTGKLDLTEFETLWAAILKWQKSFEAHDSDMSGSVSTYELRTALKDAGIQVSTHVVRVLVVRYGSHLGTLDMPSFITCACKAQRSMEEFKQHEDGPGSGKALVDLDVWMEATMYG